MMQFMFDTVIIPDPMYSMIIIIMNFTLMFIYTNCPGSLTPYFNIHYEVA